jgi:hypothetical protein
LSGCQKADGVSWERIGLLMVEFKQRWASIMPEVYCEALKSMHRAILNKTCGVPLHDNGRPHTAASTWSLPEHFNWELFDHPPYKPDLASSDYHLLTYLKIWLRSQRFNNMNNEGLMEGDKTRLTS